MVEFEGPALVTENTLQGLKTRGGNINLKNRSDVEVSCNTGGCPTLGSQMSSYDHGTIQGYLNAIIPHSWKCSGDPATYGVCHPGRI